LLQKNFTLTKLPLVENKKSSIFRKNLQIIFFSWIRLNFLSPINFNVQLNSTKPFSQPLTKFNGFLNLKSVFRRWLDSFQLFYGLFLIQEPLLVFSNPLFIEEVFLLNKTMFKKKLKLFKYVQPIFYVKEPSYGLTSFMVYQQLLKPQLANTLITDTKIHGKTLFYLRLVNSYTIGLLPNNYNPWLLSYPIPTVFESFLSQLIFIKTLLLVQKLSLEESFYDKKSYWRSIFLK